MYFGSVQRNDLEVTLLLNIASSGLIVPYARLSEDAHPSGDAIRFHEAKVSLNQVLDAPFQGSQLHPEANSGSWRFGKLKDLCGDPDAWAWDNVKPITAKKTVRPIVKVLRNALAHGNVFTKGRPHIETLVFISRIDREKPELGYECISVSPADFKAFLDCWLVVLSNAHIPGEIFTEAGIFAEFVA